MGFIVCSGKAQTPAHVFKGGFEHERRNQPRRSIPSLRVHHNSRRDRDSSFRMDCLGSRLVVSKEASPCVGTHDPCAMAFEKEPDKRPKEAAAVERIGMVNDKIALTGHFRGPTFDLLRVNEEVLMAKGFKTLCHCLGTTAGRTHCSDDSYSHRITTGRSPDPDVPRLFCMIPHACGQARMMKIQ
jgi:hypothetical protein